MDWTIASLLFCAGVAGGIINALAGGATLITFPVMLAAGLPPVAANASNAVAIAPGHLPEAWALRARTKGAIERAKSLIAAGQGDVRTSFPDLAQGIPFSIKATPNVYLSMFDPDGPAVMPKNAAAMEPVPFMWVVGIADPIIFHGKDYVFSLGAKNPKSKYMVTPSMHLSTPFQARGAIISWLKGL